MLEWAFVVLIIAAITAAYGYTRSASTSSYIAKLLFYSFLFVFLLLVIFSLFSTAPPPSSDNSKLPL